MTFAIGRAGLDVTLNNPSSITFSGRTVRMGGTIRGASVADCKAVRQQLTGYVGNPWEPVVPLQFSLDPSLEGYYAVVDASVDIPTYGYRNGAATYDVTLMQVMTHTAPLIESILNGANRPGTPGPVTVNSWWAVPRAWRPFGTETNAVSQLAPRIGPGGTIDYQDGSTNGFYDTRGLSYSAPSDYYSMAAQITDGTYSVTGREYSGSTTLTLTNGLLKWTLGVLTVPIYLTSGTYGTAHSIGLGILAGAGTAASGFSGLPTIVRNSPAEVVVRYTGSYVDTFAIYPATLDVALRRGARMLACAWTQGNSSFSSNLLVQIAHPNSAITGGMRQTSADADGNRAVVLSGVAGYGTDLTNGILSPPISTTFWDFGLGYEVGAASAVYPDAATDLRNQYYAAITETQNVIAP